MREEIKNIYEKIFELNLQINSVLNGFPKENFDDFNEKLQKLLALKDKFIQELLSLKNSNKKELENSLKEVDLQEISAQIDNLEQENLKLIQEKKIYLSKEINKTNKAAKALDGYKFNKQIEPRLFDEKD